MMVRWRDRQGKAKKKKKNDQTKSINANENWLQNTMAKI